MPRKYSHIQEHEKEILELREQGMPLREIGGKNWVLAIKQRENASLDITAGRENLQQGLFQGPGKLRSTNPVLNITKQRLNA